MKKTLGCLVATLCFTTAAWSQAPNTDTTAPRAENRAQGSTQSDNRERGAQPAAPRTQPGAAATQPEGASASGQRGRGQQGQFADRQIAALVAANARNEVEISKFAQQHLQTDDAKEFAAMMIKDHTPAMQKMQQLAGRSAEQGDDQTRARRPQRDDAAATDANPANAGNRQAGQRPRGLNWMAFHSQLADQCLQSTKKMLSEHEGHDFDKAYLGQQIVAHQETIDKLTVLRSHASTELQSEIDSNIQTAKQHLEHVKKLMHQEKDKGDSKNR